MIIRQCSRSGEHVLALFASALRSFHAPARSLGACCEVRLWCCKARTLTLHRATGRALLLRQSRPCRLQALSSLGSHACHRHGASKSRRAWATPAPTSRQHWVSNAFSTQPHAHEALQPALRSSQPCVTCSFCPRNEHGMEELAAHKQACRKCDCEPACKSMLPSPAIVRLATNRRRRRRRRRSVPSIARQAQLTSASITQ